MTEVHAMSEPTDKDGDGADGSTGAARFVKKVVSAKVKKEKEVKKKSLKRL
jgi:hypothetical protein